MGCLGSTTKLQVLSFVMRVCETDDRVADANATTRKSGSNVLEWIISEYAKPVKVAGTLALD